MDTLSISGLKVLTTIGTAVWEQKIKQPLLLDLQLAINFQHIPDELTKTIDYAALCHLVTSYVESKAFQLIETVANEVVALIQETFSIQACTVSVSKAHALPNVQNIQVIARRTTAATQEQHADARAEPTLP